MPDYNTMLTSLRESLTVPTKRDAGIILAEGGWAVFPIPDNAKFDTGLSYLHATTDGARFNDLAEDVMLRNECHDVNVALCPGKCAVPLIVVDLDGAQAVWNFFDDAKANGATEEKLQTLLRVNTTRIDHGRHIYFAAPDGKAWSNSLHKWGGEVRSGRGHVVMPPSTTGKGRYTWVGEMLYTAPSWVVEGLRGGAVGNASRDGDKSDEEIQKLLDDMSAWQTDSYARTAMNNMLAELSEARPGAGTDGRNPLLSKTINRVMDLAAEGRLNANQAVSEVAEMYESLFSPDETHRSPIGEVVRCVRSWFRNHETVRIDVADTQVLHSWAQSRGGGAAAPVDDAGNVMEREVTETTGKTPRMRRGMGYKWKKDTNK